MPVSLPRLILLISVVYLPMGRAAETAGCSPRSLDVVRDYLACTNSHNLLSCSALNKEIRDGHLSAPAEPPSIVQAVSSPFPARPSFVLPASVVAVMKSPSMRFAAAKIERKLRSKITKDLILAVEKGEQDFHVLVKDMDTSTRIVWENVALPTLKELARTHTHHVTQHLLHSALHTAMQQAMVSHTSRVVVPLAAAVVDMDIASSEIADLLVATHIHVPASLIGAGVGAVVGVVTNPASTACSEQFDNFLNKKAEENCKLDYSIGTGVILFANQSREVQLAALKSPEVCDFYEKLAANLTTGPKVQRLKCERNRALFQVKEPKGNEVIYELDAVGKDSPTPLRGRLKQLITYGGNAPNVTLQPEGMVENWSSTELMKQVVKVRMVIGDIVSCCDSRDDAQHASCLAKFNLPSLPPSSLFESETRK